jgi:hypothetical protein
MATVIMMVCQGRLLMYSCVCCASHLQPVALCDVAQDAHTHARPGEGVALDELVRNTQQPPNCAHLQGRANTTGKHNDVSTAIKQPPDHSIE